MDQHHRSEMEHGIVAPEEYLVVDLIHVDDGCVKGYDRNSEACRNRISDVTSREKKRI